MPGCYLGLRLDQPRDTHAGRVLVVAPVALLHPCVPQPDGTVLYELVTGHPDRAPHELVFLPDLTVELRAWPTDTWSKVGIDPQAAAHAVVAGWQRGDLLGDRGSGRSSRTATTSAMSGSAATPDTGRAVSGCPARGGRTAADPRPPFRRDGSAADVGLARLRWSSGPGGCSRRIPAVRTRADTGRGLPDTREPARPGTADPCDRGRVMRTCGSVHAGQSAAEPSSTAAMSDRKGPPCAAPASTPPDRQIRRLVLSVHGVILSAVCAA